jgi:hypothetical protein
MTFTMHPDIPDINARNVGESMRNADTDAGRVYFTRQRPYRNGITVYASSLWGGNGFGTQAERIAVNKDGQIVAFYLGGGFGCNNANYVIGVGEIDPDIGRMGGGYGNETYVKRTAFHKWIEAVKAL